MYECHECDKILEDAKSWWKWMTSETRLVKNSPLRVVRVLWSIIDKGEPGQPGPGWVCNT